MAFWEELALERMRLREIFWFRVAETGRLFDRCRRGNSVRIAELQAYEEGRIEGIKQAIGDVADIMRRAPPVTFDELARICWERGV